MTNPTDSANFDLGAELQRLLPKAAQVCREILTNPTAKKADKLKAATLLGQWAGLNSKNTVNVNIGAPVEEIDYTTLSDAEFRALIGLPANLDISRVSDADLNILAGVEDIDWDTEP